MTETEDPVTVWFQEFDHINHSYGAYICGRTFLREDTSPTMRRAAYWAILRCRWFCPSHDRQSCDWPSAGRHLHWSIRCTNCGCKYIHLTPNTPRWRGPFQYDSSKPKQYFPSTRKGFYFPLWTRLTSWLGMKKHNWFG